MSIERNVSRAEPNGRKEKENFNLKEAGNVEKTRKEKSEEVCRVLDNVKRKHKCIKVKRK